MSQTIDKSGHGVVIFTEDIDQVTRGNRDAAMQDILNTLDGGDTKNMNVIALFTTNHIELIEPTFLRGKRIGTIISLGYLDKETAERFIRQSLEIGNYTVDDDISQACELIERSNIAPAFMAEIIEKVKSMLIYEDTNHVTNDDIRYSVESYREQMALAQTKDMSETPEKKFVESFRELFGVDKTSKKVEQILGFIENNWEADRDDYAQDFKVD